MRVLPPGNECERQNPKKLEKVAISHFFDTQSGVSPLFYLRGKARYAIIHLRMLLNGGELMDDSCSCTGKQASAEGVHLCRFMARNRSVAA